MSISIPQEILTATQMTEAEINTELAVVLFAKEKLTLAQAARMTGKTRIEFQALLASRGIPLHYTVEQFDEELSALRRAGV